MKGIVFTEFIEMVEDRFGLEVSEKMIAGADLPNGGAYTAVGTYDHTEIVRMVRELGNITDARPDALVCAFGEHLFGRLASMYGHFFQHADSTFKFLAGIEHHIHAEVRKLYPEAELPTFECRQFGERRLELLYRSSRHFGDLAEGMIRGCIRHFREPIEMQRDNLSSTDEGSAIRFMLALKSA